MTAPGNDRFTDIVSRSAGPPFVAHGFVERREAGICFERTTAEDVRHAVAFYLDDRSGGTTFFIQLRVELGFFPDGFPLSLNATTLFRMGELGDSGGEWEVPEDDGALADLAERLASALVGRALRWFEPRTTLEELSTLFRNGAVDGVEHEAWPLPDQRRADPALVEALFGKLAPQPGQLDDGRRRPPIYWFWLALCQSRLGREAAMNEAFDRYLAANPSKSSVARVERARAVYVDQSPVGA